MNTQSGSTAPLPEHLCVCVGGLLKLKTSEKKRKKKIIRSLQVSPEIDGFS